jgi:hypothetical protein
MKRNLTTSAFSASLALLVTGTALTLQLGSPVTAGHAQSHPTAPSACTTSEARNAELEQLLDDYVRAHRASSALRKSRATKRVREKVFAAIGTPCYVNALQQIDARARTNSAEIYELSRALQLHWEAQYAVGLGQRRTQRVERGTKIGAMIGMAALGAALFYRPSAAPRYFKIVRHLFPLAGVAGGNATAVALNQSGLMERNLPLAPAHVMRLGIQTDEFELDDAGLTRELVTLTASIGAAGMAYDVLKAVRVFRAINVASTPIKVHPVALVGSLVVGFVVEEGVGAAAHRYEYNRLIERLQSDRANFEAAASRGDDAAALSHSERLVRSAAAIAAFLNAPIHEAIRSFDAEVAEAQADHLPGSARLERALREASDDLREAIEEALADRPYDRNSAYETFLVLGYLRNKDEASIQGLNTQSQDRAEIILSTFGSYIAAREQENHVCFDHSPREAYFQEFIAGFSQAEDRRLARQLRNGVIRKEAKHVLLMTLAALRSSGKDYLQDQVDFLSTLIHRDDLLTATTTGRAFIP